MIQKEQYLEHIKKTIPKSPMMRTLLAAFVVGGFICCIGEAVGDITKAIVPDISEEDLGGWVSVTMIFLGSFLTAIGVYDRIGHFAGAGSIIPITGFANSVVSPAIEYNREGVVFGICAKMFTIAGPIIVFGMVGSLLVGIIGLFL